MTWRRYAGGDYQPDVNIRLEDVVGVTVDRNCPTVYSVTVYYSDGQKMSVGTFSPVESDDPCSKEGLEMARERAEEIKAAVDKAKGGLWRWLAQALGEIDFSLPVEERLRRIGVRFKVHKTPHGDLILFDKPNFRGSGEPRRRG